MDLELAQIRTQPSEFIMPVTYNCHQIGQKAAWKKSAFEGRAVRVDNPHQILAAETYKALQIFNTKKETIEFCRQWKLPQNQILKVESRFFIGWAIGLGHSLFVPDLAEGLMFAHLMGCEVSSIVDERMWLAA